jgi:hypothetical protein
MGGPLSSDNRVDKCLAARFAVTYDPLNPSRKCGTVPNTEMQLRWTSAFKAKAEKCAEYRRKGIDIKLPSEM